MKRSAPDDSSVEEVKPKKKVIVVKKVAVKVVPQATTTVKAAVKTEEVTKAARGIVKGHFGTSDASIGGKNNVGTVYPGEEGQNGFTLTKPQPTRDPVTKCYHFADYPTFTPNISPEEIIRQGSFGGGYWRVITSAKGKVCRNDWSDLPAEWYEGLDKARLMTNMTYNAKVNKWACKVGQSYDAWEESGWLELEHDSRGWFHWYTRFWMGRRCADDTRQLGRYKGIAAAASGRWRRMLYGKYLTAGVEMVDPKI